MRLIDADALMDELTKVRWAYQMLDDTWAADKAMGGLRDAEQKVKDAPTIDAEPVVRCKDCKHFADDYVDTGFGPIPAFSCDVYELYGARLSINHYCAYGEREDDATD